MSSSFSRETIHVSLGLSANAVSAHVLNLQGLAATSSSEACDAHVTHTVQNDVLVPRAILVEERRRPPQNAAATSKAIAPEHVVSTWSGEVEVMTQQQQQQQQQEEEGDDDNQDDDDDMQGLRRAADALAYASHSRYRRRQRQRRQTAPYSSSANQRHVLWNDLEGQDEEEEEDYMEDDDDEKQRRLERQQWQWQTQTRQPLEAQMESFWCKRQQEQNLPPLHWSDYWMPPHPKNALLTLPFARDDFHETTWDSYIQGTVSGEELMERLRKVLEDCDSVQGITVATEGCGVCAGLATELLQVMQDECRSAGRLVWHVNAAQTATTETTDSYNDANDKSAQQENISPLLLGQSVSSSSAAQRFRKQMQRGLAFHGLTTHAHAVLPLQYNNKSKQTMLQTAQLGLALEVATLGYRLSGSDSNLSKIGLVHGFYGGSGVASEGYGTASRASFGEYLACLQPASQYCLLELDASLSTNADALEQELLAGTSIERVQRRQQGEREVDRPRDVLPGLWLEPRGGLLQSLSYSSRNGPSTDMSSRSVHRHFALTASSRPAVTTAMPPRLSTSQYVTCLIEGMVPRYRPEASMATVLQESVEALTAGGYGVGAYWKSLHMVPPVLSILGNSTRCYSHVASVTNDMKSVFAPRYRAYHNRDVAQGILPEVEDCEEALQGCCRVRDDYKPPQASELVDDEEGYYFESNVD